MLWMSIVQRSILHILQLAPLISGGKEDAGNGKFFPPHAMYPCIMLTKFHSGT